MFNDEENSIPILNVTRFDYLKEPGRIVIEVAESRPDKLSTAILTVLNRAEEKRSQQLQAARFWAPGFSWQRSGRRILNILEKTART